MIQQVHDQRNNQWHQLLQVIGSKSSHMREKLLQQLIQRNIPFTKNSLEKMFTLLDDHSNEAQASKALIEMMHHKWPLTKELMESVIAFQSSTFTKQIHQAYESLFQYTSTNQVHQSLVDHLEKLQPTTNEIVHHKTVFLRTVQHMVHNIGLSYERMLLEDDVNASMNTLKGLLMQFIQGQEIGAKQAKSLLQFIQGMQLHAVQETMHMVSVQLFIPAMIGRLQSDIHLTFDSKKTAKETIDPEYCRILFDLNLADLKRTMIDMHIQNKQVSFVVYTDFAYIRQVATPLESSFKKSLQKTGYEVTSIRYQALHKHEHKQFHKSKKMNGSEGFDMKI